MFRSLAYVLESNTLLWSSRTIQKSSVYNRKEYVKCKSLIQFNKNQRLNRVLSLPGVLMWSDENLYFQSHCKRLTTLLLYQIFVEFFTNSYFFGSFFRLFRFSLFLLFSIFHTAFVCSPSLGFDGS